ncbi:PASTA domain-containing protein [Haloplanus aerogenes]|uniref:PASTA domain-containing protein n=1 Tax=Haloplanus aerogenes TaxID=660522 RepID=A0A3M0DNY8_9EURY|nr:PASTA domain-containing protein [Haloplanus aerogenes]AZH24729.1 PASTA domain-containing protein [Haloplanus aerogenes]RMB23611.1 PASTA domain-containing protein [Haloplanus aerogenes]
MPGDDFQFTTALATLDASKLDRAEKREVEGLYRAKEYLTTALREQLIEVESERDLLRTKVDRLQAERDAIRDRLDGLEADRGTVAPDRLVASLGDALATARDDLSEADYAIGRIEVDLKANVVGGADGPQFQLPDLAESVNREALSTLRFDLRPATRDETVTYDPIPDVRDRSLDEAREAIRRAGFAVGEVATEPGDADDVVLDQFPSPRSVAEPGTAVDLTVSERREIDVPAVIGHDLTDATAALSAADLAVGEIDAETRDEPPDVVVGQTPPAGDAVPVGTAVDLTVSAGPPDEGTESADEQDGNVNERASESDAGPALEAVDGIGPTYADRLREAGITDLSALLDREPAAVADITRASTSRVEDWFGHAKRLLEGE